MVHIMTVLISTTLIMSLVFTELGGADAVDCNRTFFDYGVYNYCIPIYQHHMAAFNYQDECPWPTAKRYYKDLDVCVRHVGSLTACSEHSLMDKIFLDLHRTYFSHCYFLKDPDVPILMLLTLPCIIATFLLPFFCTYLTTWEYSIND